MPTCGDYTMRAQPRRRVADDREEPIFLRKTFEMICSCDADKARDLACWSTNGGTFVVKDPDAFAQLIIPRFFKRELCFVVVLCIANNAAVVSMFAATATAEALALWVFDTTIV